jgi:hypothetical protein
MVQSEVLQYGAIGIGLIVLGYSVVLLKQELSQSRPRAQACALIFSFMVFSLFSFGIATYVAIDQRRLNADTERQIAESITAKKIADAGKITRAIDAHLGDRYAAAIGSAPAPQKERLKEFGDLLCNNLKELKGVLSGNEDTQCKVSFPSARFAP